MNVNMKIMLLMVKVKNLKFIENLF